MICFKVGQPWITIHKKFVPNYFLYLIRPKNSIFSPSAKIKIAPSPRLHPQSDHIINTHTKPVYRPKHTSDLKNSHFGYAGFQEKFDTPPLKPAKTEPSFRKLNSPPTKLRMLFPAHFQARELCPQTYSLSLPLEWSQVTHIPASIKLGGAYKPESQLSTVPWPDNCVMIPVFQDGSLPFHHTHKHSSPLWQALHTQMANHHIQRARKSF